MGRNSACANDRINGDASSVTGMGGGPLVSVDFEDRVPQVGVLEELDKAAVLDIFIVINSEDNGVALIVACEDFKL